MVIALWAIAVALGLIAHAMHEQLDSRRAISRNIERLADAVERAIDTFEPLVPSDPDQVETMEEREARWQSYQSGGRS